MSEKAKLLREKLKLYNNPSDVNDVSSLEPAGVTVCRTQRSLTSACLRFFICFIVFNCA